MPQKRTVCYLASAKSIHSKRWATHFSSLGYDVHVVSFDDDPIPGVRVHLLPLSVLSKPLALLLTLPKLKRILRSIGPSILHAHYATSYGILGALSGIKPLIITAWGSDVLIMPQRSRMIRRALVWSFSKAILITSMADHMSMTLRDLGVDSQKIITLPFGIDTAVFHPGLQAKEKDIDIICTRPCDPIYNVELFLRSLPPIVARCPDLRTVLIGGGRLERELKALSKELGLEAHIQWVGHLALPDVANWLGRAKVFVSPSLSDGNNISLNEAMACGCLPVCTDIPANREWLKDGENGYLVPVSSPEILAERICHALASPEFRERAAARNWQIISQRGDWNKNMAVMNEHYQRIMTGLPMKIPRETKGYDPC